MDDRVFEPGQVDLDTKLEEWEARSSYYGKETERYQDSLTKIQDEYTRLSKVGATTDYKPLPSWLNWLPGESLAEASMREAQLGRLKPQIDEAFRRIERNDFYYRLYGEVPFVIAGKKTVTADDILSQLQVPADMTPDEMEEITDVINGMISTIQLGQEPLPEYYEEGTIPELVDLVAPTEVEAIPLSIQKVTIDSLLNSLTMPEPPDPILTQNEYAELLYGSGQVEKEGDVLTLEQQAEALVLNWQERNNRLEAFRNGLAEMPAYTAIDRLKDMIVKPGLLIMDMTNIYFEHVTQPLAGLLYKNFSPDIEAEYQRLRQSAGGDPNHPEPGLGVWQAAAKAWENWDTNWFLKYMVMEAVVDPLTYVGWGIATKLTKPIPYVGRWVGAAERGITELMELPFDAIKAVAKKLPTTMGQRALRAQHEAGQITERFLTRWTGKLFNQITMDDFEKAATEAFKFLERHPQSEEDIAQFARQLLKHLPMSEDQVRSWASTLGSKFTAEQITGNTIEAVNNLVEDILTYNIRNKRSIASKIVGLLGAENTDDTVKLAERLLTAHQNAIINQAKMFNKAKGIGKAMQALMRRNYRYHIAIEESAAYLQRMKNGRFSAFLFNPETDQTWKNMVRIWQKYVDNIVIKPTAQAYLTFGMYGPMNVLEDYFRSALGNVIPRRMTTESYQKLVWGLTGDPDMMRYGLSEMGGFLAREGAEENWNNWILQLFTLGHKGWADKLYTGLVRMPGAYGMDIRRNFVAKRFMQILQEKGGDVVEQLAKAGPKPPKTINSKIAKALEAEVYRLKLTGNPDLIRGAKDLFTRQSIRRAEVKNILSQYPELPNSARAHILQSVDDQLLFAEGAKSIDLRVGETNQMVLDEFLKGPEFAQRQYEQLAALLTDLEVTSPQDMAELLQSVHFMSELSGATPKQVLAQATIKSRGLPFGERRAMLEAEYQKIYGLIGKSNASVEKVVGKIRASLATERVMPKRFRALTDFIDQMPPGAQEAYADMTNFLDLYSQLAIKGTDFSDEGVDALYNLVSRGTSPEQELMSYLDDFGFPEAETLRRVIREAEASPSRLNKVVAIDVFAQVSHDRGSLLPTALYKEVGKGVEYDFFSEYADDIGRLIRDIFDDLQTGDVTTHAIMGQEGIDASNMMLDILTTRRQALSEWQEINLAMRSEIFAGASASDLKMSGFWDDFYSRMDAHYSELDELMAELDGQLVRATKQVNRANGVVETRPPISVKDRPLAPADVAQLLGVRSDDISRGILDAQVAQNSKAHFVQYVLGHVEPGDTGFTKEAIEQVYDQIAISLGVDPATVSWMTSKQMSLEGMRHDLHELWNSKLLPDNEIADIGKYVDDVADSVSSLVGKDIIKLTPFESLGNDIIYDVTIGDNILRGAITAEDIGDTLLVKEITSGAGELITRGNLDNSLAAFVKLAKGKGLKYIDIDVLGKKSYEDLARKFGFTKFTGDSYATREYPGANIYRLDVSKVSKVMPIQLKQEFTNYQQLRQSSLDEAFKWYYKEYPDYTHANAFDAMMKTIYPYWTYESQRWFWLPRSFVRHPVTMMELGRYQNNSDHGYIHIPGTAIDINPFRGTVYGTMTTRLTRIDYPEYYDSLDFAGGYVEFMDFLSRYGFYPGAHMSIPLALLGGREAQFGEALPATYKTGLDAMIAMFPESEAVKAISESLFNDRFRDYLTLKEVSKRGGNGTLIYAKIEKDEALTPEEQSLWDASRAEVSIYSAGFEQFGLFRLRSEEQYAMYENAAKAIEEMTGYTPEQQDWLRSHNFKLWDIVGGMSKTEQQVLKQLDYYRWVGSVRPLLPGKQQEILNQIELAWDDVKRYTESLATEKLQIQREFLSGQIGPQDYNDKLISIYMRQREYIDQKMVETSPTGKIEDSIMTLEGRADYNREYDIPMPVQHPMNELLSLYFEIELETKIDEETGQKINDWDKFWAMREAVENAIPEDLKQEWDDYLSRNSTRLEQIRRVVYQDYLRPYNEVWDAVLKRYSESEQKLIEEYLYLERTGQQLDRQEEIKNTVLDSGRKIISQFRSEISEARRALRYANPSLDAWLYYWGRTSSFQTDQAEEVYKQLCQETGRKV